MAQLIHYVNMAKAGFSLDYGDFSKSDLLAMEYISLKSHQEERKENFKIFFEAIDERIKKIMRSFRHK